MMGANAILRGAGLIVAVLFFALPGSVSRALAQDVGVDVGGSVFRAKNPETKKKTAKPDTTAKPGNRSTGNTRVRPAVAERIEDLLEKGNEARDARRFTDAEAAYKEILRLKARDARAAYGLGNIYFDQQRWDDAEAAYRNSVAWAPFEPGVQRAPTQRNCDTRLRHRPSVADRSICCPNHTQRERRVLSIVVFPCKRLRRR